MTPRLHVAVTSGDQRVALEIVDGVVNVIETSEDLSPLMATPTRGAAEVLLPSTPGATFEITVDLDAESPPS